MTEPFLQDPDVTLWHGDVLDVLRRMDADSADCVITSPPYIDARLDYDHVGVHEYGDWSAQWLGETFRIVTHDGSLLLNLGRLFRGGVELDYWMDVLNRARTIGWKWIDTVFWYKPNGPARSGPYLTNSIEYVFWLAPSTDAYRGYDETRTPYAQSTLARYGRNWARNTRVKGSHVKQSGRTPHPLGARPSCVFLETVGREKGNEHPAPMPLALAGFLVRLGCPPGGLVLDPFAGSGTTILAARNHGRRGVGIDLSRDYLELAARRLQQLSLLAEPA